MRWMHDYVTSFDVLPALGRCGCNRLTHISWSLRVQLGFTGLRGVHVAIGLLPAWGGSCCNLSPHALGGVMLHLVSSGLRGAHVATFLLRFPGGSCSKFSPLCLGRLILQFFPSRILSLIPFSEPPRRTASSYPSSCWKKNTC